MRTCGQIQEEFFPIRLPPSGEILIDKLLDRYFTFTNQETVGKPGQGFAIKTCTCPSNNHQRIDICPVFRLQGDLGQIQNFQNIQAIAELIEGKDTK